LVIKSKISPLTIQRLSTYLRGLKYFAQEEGKASVSSDDIALWLGGTAAQVRKDLSYFGSFGKKGRGYNVDELIKTLEDILGLDKSWKVALIGLGRLGRSMAVYKGFRNSSFEIVAIFDIDPQKVGTKYNETPVYHLDDLTRVCEEEGILISIVATPAEVANKVFQIALDAGIRGILNLSGRSSFNPPPHAFIKDVNMEAEIESLSFCLTHY